MYDYATPQKLLEALKANNPLYVDIDIIDEEWLEKAIANDAELCDCLVQQQNDNDVQTDSLMLLPKAVLLMLYAIMFLIWIMLLLLSVLIMRMPFQAVHKLETIASQNGFTIHDVPYDGNCICSVLLHIS